MKKIFIVLLLFISVITFTACSEKKITISVDNNEQQIKPNTLITNIPKPTNNKKAFDKWLVNGQEIDNNYTLKDGDKLTACWRDFKFYKVVFKNTLTPIQDQIIREDKKVVKPNTPTKKYYEFKGWYDGDNLFEFDKFITKDITLTAKWESIEAPMTKVKLDINGTIKDFEGYYASDLPTPDDTDTGYFTHWTINDNKVDNSYELKDGDKLIAKYTEYFTKLYYFENKKEILTDTNVDLLDPDSYRKYYIKEVIVKHLKLKYDTSKELKPKDYINFIPKLDGYKIILAFVYRTDKNYNEEKINGILCTTLPPKCTGIGIEVVKE